MFTGWYQEMPEKNGVIDAGIRPARKYPAPERDRVGIALALAPAQGKQDNKGGQNVSKGAAAMRYFGRKGEEGKIGYIILWLMGVPAGLLFLIFLLRGCT